MTDAVARGLLPQASTLPCALCGASAAEYDHWRGYEPEHRLDVRALCRRCHAAQIRSPRPDAVTATDNPVVVALDAWRMDLGLTHRLFAAHIGTDESHWCELRAGRAAPSRRWVRQLKAKPGDLEALLPFDADPSVPTQMRVPRTLFDRATAVAAATGHSRSTVLRLAIEQGLPLVGELHARTLHANTIRRRAQSARAQQPLEMGNAAG